MALVLGGCVGEESPGTVVPRFDTADLEHGRAVWMQVCRNCHLMGIAGAPAISDSAAWASRRSDNRNRLYENAIRGIGSEGGWSMPPRGGNETLSDHDVRLAVDFMIASVEALQSD